MFKKISLIRSGGQTGVDRAALDAAKAMEVPVTGWCPKNGWAEDFPDFPGIREIHPELKETPLSDPKQRTAWNVRDSHATLVILPRPFERVSSGTALTVEVAKSLGRPLYVTDSKDVSSISAWLDSLGKELDLNIAGPRESEAPGIYGLSLELLKKLLTDIGMGPSGTAIGIRHAKRI